MLDLRVKYYDHAARRPRHLYLPLGTTQAEINAYTRHFGTRKYEGLLKSIGDNDLSVGQVLELFSDAEIRQAAHRRLAQLAPHSNEYKELTRLVQDPQAWRRSQGGDEARRAGGFHGDVPAVRGSRQDVFGANASRGDDGDPEGKSGIRKSMLDREQARATAKSHGFRVQQMAGETMHMIHPARPGETLVIGEAGAWERSMRGSLVAKGMGADDLEGHLSTAAPVMTAPHLSDWANRNLEQANDGPVRRDASRPAR